MYFRLSLIFTLLVGLVAFALQNSVLISINLWFWDLESSLAMIVILCIAGGALVSVLIDIPTTIKRRKEISSLRKEIKSLNEQISYLQETSSENSSKRKVEHE
ncbi:MAG: LapA family protein [Reichenbachiella sp.]|uniref:LapA family protein n=1 Tax=Reichenbachiella sp. TaxID=2184521 RepID=UPI0032666067